MGGGRGGRPFADISVRLPEQIFFWDCTKESLIFAVGIGIFSSAKRTEKITDKYLQSCKMFCLTLRKKIYES